MKKVLLLLILIGIIVGQEVNDLASSDAVTETQNVEAIIEKFPED